MAEEGLDGKPADPRLFCSKCFLDPEESLVREQAAAGRQTLSWALWRGSETQLAGWSLRASLVWSGLRASDCVWAPAPA